MYIHQWTRAEEEYFEAKFQCQIKHYRVFKNIYLNNPYFIIDDMIMIDKEEPLYRSVSELDVFERVSIFIFEVEKLSCICFIKFKA